MSGLLILLGSSATVYLAYYFLYVRQKPKLYAGNPRIKTFLERHLPILQDPYSPSPLYFEGRLQTILGLTFREVKPRKLPYRRKLFSLKDGGEIGLDFAMVRDQDENEDKQKLLVVLFPGLTSTSQSCYVRSIVKVLNGLGASVVVFNNRGLAGVPFKTPRTYCASNTEDVEEVIGYLKQKFPNQRMMALGTSLGAMVLSKYILNNPKDAKDLFEAAVLLCIPWDAMGGTMSLQKDWINRNVINKQLTDSLVKLGKKFLQNFDPPKGFDVQTMLKAKTVKDFDTAVTAPMFGFGSVEEYYASATIKGQVHKFPIPVFNLNAEDDPVAPAHDLPIDEALAKGSNLGLVATSYGGHLGHLEGFGNKTSHFLERYVEQLVSAIQEHGEELRD